MTGRNIPDSLPRAAASCSLPLSQNPNLSKELGTRHTAGLGVSEESDAVVIIVSEETGNISLAIKGELFFNISPESMQNRLKSPVLWTSIFALLLTQIKSQKLNTIFLQERRIKNEKNSWK